MDLKLHANATTTPRIRAYIRKSPASNAALARELGIHSRTVARWKDRQDTTDRSTRPHRLNTSLTQWEEAIVVELRRSLALPLDDIVEVVRRCLNPERSRSAIHRCLQRHAISARLTRDKAAAAAFHTDAPAGFIHIDVKYLPPLDRRRRDAYVAIDRATRFVYLEILPDRRADTAAGFLQRFVASFPLTVHTVLTDNGSEFTDRFAVDKKRKPHDKPSGQHPFDRACAGHRIDHRLTRPFRPQTNGMVERFNRRIGEHLDRVPQNAPRITAASTTTPSATPISMPSSPTTIAPVCDASTIMRPPRSSPISRDTTRRPGTAMARRSFWPPFVTSIPGCDTSLPTALTPGPSLAPPSTKSASGRSKSASAPTSPQDLSSCRGVGLSSAPSPGSTATDASPKTLRLPWKAPSHGCSRPAPSSSCGDSAEQHSQTLQYESYSKTSRADANCSNTRRWAYLLRRAIRTMTQDYIRRGMISYKCLCTRVR